MPSNSVSSSSPSHTLHKHMYKVMYTFMYIVYWELSAEEKVPEFHESGSIRECFLEFFILARIFIYEIA